MVRVRVLGPAEVALDGAPIALPAGKPTEVLVRLALDAGVLVRAERLIEDLWGTEAATTGRNTLQTKVSRLRRSLGDALMITGDRAGYVLEVDPSAVDAIEVLHLAAAAKELLANGSIESAGQQSAQALAMFRGEVLTGAGDGDWLIPHRVRLDEVRLGLVETHLTARLHLGRAGDVIGELEALVAEYPVREALWVLLITALYREGRQADALAAYQRIRALLADELGLDPSPDLRALEQRVLRHDDVLRAGPARVTPAGPSRVQSNIAALSAPLVGRTHEMHDLAQLLTEQRLVTLVGPAGVGKTRLATEVARGDRARDGVWLARLENAATPAALALALGEALSMSGPTDAMVIDRLRAAEMVLVLDNCEHLVDAVAALTTRVLDHAPGVRILATSQVALGLDGEEVYPLEPLPLADSVALFAQRALARRQAFVLDADTSTAVEDVCRSLDGLPLAIELAAARTKALSVQEIARRIGDRFALLSDPGSRRPVRHRTLGSAIQWSYDLLFPDEQRGLWALACFSGGAPIAAAEDLINELGVPAESAIDIVGRLVDRSLVTVDVGPTGAVRYRLLDSVRAFAFARLQQADLAEVAQRAHARWFAAAADRAGAEQRGPGQAPHLATVRIERANIDAALAWAAGHDPLLGLQIANGFGWSSVVLGEGGVAAERLRAALAVAEPMASPAQRALTLALIGWNESGADIGRARADAERAVEIADGAGDDRALAESRFALAFVLIHQGHPRAALDVIDEWRATAGDLGPTWPQVMASVLIGYAGLAVGEVTRVRGVGETALAALDIVGDDWLTSHIEAIIGQLAQSENRLPEAATHLGRAAAAAHRAGVPAAEGYHLASLGRIQQLAGDDATAVATLERAIELIRTVGLMRPVALAQVRLGRVLRALGRVAPARSVLVAADEWFQASGGGGEALLAHCLLAAMDAQARTADAGPALETILAAARASDDVEVQVLALDALAALRVEAADDAGARALLDIGDGLMPRARHRMVESDRIDAARARSLLGPDGRTAAH